MGLVGEVMGEMGGCVGKDGPIFVRIGVQAHISDATESSDLMTPRDSMNNLNTEVQDLECQCALRE